MDADDLANKFTMTTAEVEAVNVTGAHLLKIKVVEIQSLKKHPEADKLNLVTFTDGKETYEVVCGAANVREGLKVPYAPLGVTLPNGVKLEAKEIRGVMSKGMLCSETELGIGEGASGLMELPSEAPLGQCMADYLQFPADIILDIDNKSLTHRPDLWGHYGMAREFSAAYTLKLNDPFNETFVNKMESHFTSAASPIVPVAESDSACLAYWGLSVDGIKVEASPLWLKNRLESVGLRSINNIVDISNYVMLELGIPLHIFDRQKIKDNKIVIKRVGSANGLSFTTLDEVPRHLESEDTVICDSHEPLVLAGVMGGLNSSVTFETTSIFVEVANWKADEVRKTSTRLGLRTDSSARYEKSLDSLQCYQSLLRTLDLVLQLCPKAKVIGKAEYTGPDLSKIQSLVIETSPAKIRSVLGHEVSDDKIKEIFAALAFKVMETKNSWQVELPTFRTTKDIELEADLIEEVGRMIGYDNIKPVSPLTTIKATRFTPEKQLARKIQDFMTLHARSLEVMTYPLVGKKLLEKASWPVLSDKLTLVNALSQDADRMRPSLIPSILEAAAQNTKNFASFHFFELGRIYKSCDKNFSTEHNQLAILSYNKDQSCFLDLLNQVERLLNFLNLSFDFAPASDKFKNDILDHNWPGTHPHEFLNLRIMGKFLGAVSTIHPLVLRNFKIKGNLSVAIIDLSSFEQRVLKEKVNYKPIAKFPQATFDCTFIIPATAPAGDLLLEAKKIKMAELTIVRVIDIYQMASGERAVTLRAIFEDDKKTLTPEVIKQGETLLLNTLTAAGYQLKA
jgi:phenylalanyl-tRNA synthetase beta chain